MVNTITNREFLGKIPTFPLNQQQNRPFSSPLLCKPSPCQNCSFFFQQIPSSYGEIQIGQTLGFLFIGRGRWRSMMPCISSEMGMEMGSNGMAFKGLFDFLSPLLFCFDFLLSATCSFSTSSGGNGCKD